MAYICKNCGYKSTKWLGRCPNCGEWNTFEEEKKGIKKEYKKTSSSLKEVKKIERERIKTGIDEFDRVVGGGLVSGSFILLGGIPGIGKSTLLLQIAQKLAQKDKKVLYISGEESPEQIKMRADRIDVNDENILITKETSMDDLIEEVKFVKPDFLICDSIQTLKVEDMESPPGSVAQVRECGAKLLDIAKSLGITVFAIGHVTKEGIIAGPKTLEHMVDTVLYLEGDKSHLFRILRAEKNRFGPTNEIGLFEMTDKGMIEVKDPSRFFLRDKKTEPGEAISCTVEGTRPLLIEIQALSTECKFGYPQRITSGYDYNRFSMLLAVIERNLEIYTGDKNIFLNVVGGLKLRETACDLAVVMAIVSAILKKKIKEETVLIGEVGLLGEIIEVPMLDKRIKEAQRLGFKHFITPENTKTIKEAFQKMFG